MIKQLQRDLNRFLGGKPKRAPDLERKDREGFKRLAADNGLKWSKSLDGYIEIDPTVNWPRGLSFAHYGWPESHERLKHCLRHPEAVVDGYYSE